MMLNPEVIPWPKYNFEIVVVVLRAIWRLVRMPMKVGVGRLLCADLVSRFDLICREITPFNKGAVIEDGAEPE